MKSLITASSAIVLALVLTGSAMPVYPFAQDAASDQAEPAPGEHHGGGLRQACGDDMARLCSDADRQARRQCMMDKFDQLSDGCKAAVSAMRERRSGGGAAASGAPAQPAS